MEGNNQTNMSDHDLLIQLSTKVDLWHKEQMRLIEDVIKDQARSLSQVDMKITAAHTRMDEFETQIEEFGSLKDKVLGGAAVVMFFFSAVISIVAIIKS